MFAGPWVLCSVNPKSQDLGFWWTCLRHASFLLDRQCTLSPTSSSDPLCSPGVHQRPARVRLSPRWARSRAAVPTAVLAHTPLLAAAFGIGFEQGSSSGPGWLVICSEELPRQHKPVLVSISSPFATKGSFLVLEMPFFPHYSLLVKPKPEKQADKLNKLFVSHCLTQWKHWSPRGLRESTQSAKPWLRMCPASIKYLSTGHKSNSPMSSINPHKPFLRNGMLES